MTIRKKYYIIESEKGKRTSLNPQKGNAMKTRKINWKKIGIITPDKTGMTEESINEMSFAYDSYREAFYTCKYKRALYILRQIKKHMEVTEK